MLLLCYVDIFICVRFCKCLRCERVKLRASWIGRLGGKEGVVAGC